ncbi:MAG: hypothetical protein OEL77_07920 [Nitrosopumilus sp.]|nr:hypothetical protein [Nitrosopumilus sp.]MDH3385923.1 hypothetical protein [Nitrosopumilus sp.]
MVKRVTYVVYVLPVVLSVLFGSIVLSDILEHHGRELNLLQVGSIGEISHNESIEIIGLQKQYSILEPIQIQVIIDDLSFACGDLYVTIFTPGKNVISQSGYFEQCFDTENSFLPTNEEFSEIVDVPGRYELEVKINDRNQKNSITTSKEFTVK